MIRAIYPGSFDPVTLGHLDIIQRAARNCDELIVGVLNNKSKSPLFTVEERVAMLKDVVRNIPNVRIMAFSGLLVDFAREQGDIASSGGCGQLRILSTNFRWHRRTVYSTKKLIRCF